MVVTEKALRNYLFRLQKKHLPTFPIISLHILHQGDFGYSIVFGGWARLNLNKIEIQSWLLVDKKQSYSAIRHELAHFLHCWTGQEITRSHGKEFRKSLKIISPKRWKEDLHWTETPELVAAMVKSPEQVKYIAKCQNCNFERMYKRVPAYVRNKKVTCPMCKEHIFSIERVRL